MSDASVAYWPGRHEGDKGVSRDSKGADALYGETYANMKLEDIAAMAREPDAEANDTLANLSQFRSSLVASDEQVGVIIVQLL